jgi:hypothetical protein
VSDSTNNFRMRRRLKEARTLDDAGIGPARVLLAKAPPCSVCKHWAGLERKRRVLWHNQPRNRAVATAAKAVRERDLKRALGVRLRKEDLPQGRVGRKVMILVESTEHAHAVLGMLPGWQMLDAVPVDYPEGYAPDDDEDAEPPAGWVVTLVYATLHGIEAGVLVRATGGSGKLRLRGFPPEEGVKAGLPLLIDVNDEFDAQARMDTEVRVRDYKEQGWQVIEPALK